MKTCKHFILTIKENCQMDNHGKFGKKLLLQNYGPTSLISWHSNEANYALGGDFVSYFSTRGSEFCTEKL